MAAYSARGKTPDEILLDFEKGVIAEHFGGNAAEYMQAALTASEAEVQQQAAGAQKQAAETQEQWGKIAAISGWVGAIAAVAAVVVAALNAAG
jgi:anti-sigma-K factor RskA